MERATPTFNDMASKGIILDQFYTSPTCTPSRASLLTGKYTIHIGLQDSVIHATEPRGLDLQYTLLPKKLASKGYKNYMLGKWHLGFHQKTYTPNKRGFDEFFGILTGGGGHYSHISSATFTVRGTEYKTNQLVFEGYNLWHNEVPVQEEEDPDVSNQHTTDIYTTKALKYLDDQPVDQPFFMYLSFQAIHAPMQAPEEYYDGTLRTGCHQLTTGGEFLDNRKKLCGMVAMLDESMSKLREKLMEKNIWENTVIFFMSDNGGIINHGSLNTPLRGEKGFYFEGGIRVPAFIGGGLTEKVLEEKGIAPYRSSALTHVTDVHAMILSLANVQDDDIDGVDQWSQLLSGSETDARKEIVYNINSEEFGNAGAIRVGDYKLLIEAKVSESEIYSFGQNILQDGNFDSTEIVKVIQNKILRNQDGYFYLYNIKKNPSEQDSGDCEDVEECNNLYYLPEFTSLKQTMLEKWEEYKSSMVVSNEKWEDDGPLTNPEMFGGIWTPWRDEDNQPYGTYSLVAVSNHFSDFEEIPQDAKRKLSTNAEQSEQTKQITFITPREFGFAIGGIVIGIVGAVFLFTFNRSPPIPTYSNTHI